MPRHHITKENKEISGRWRKKKLIVAAAAFLFMFVYLIMQMRHWQEIGEDIYVLRTMNQVLNRHTASDGLTPPMRGSIRDRNLQIFARSYITYNVILDVRMLNQRSEQALLNHNIIFTEFFGLSQEEIQHMLAQDTHYFTLESDIPYSRRVAFDEWMNYMHRQAQAEDTPRSFVSRDIGFRGVSQRDYVHGHIASPVLGFYHGLWWGLEHVYNEILSGTYGRSLTVFGSDGRIATTRVPATHGSDLITTLDLNIQRAAEELVVYWAGRSSANNASIIVKNPNTGEILAMAQYPSFNANSPASLDGLTTSQIELLSELEPNSQEFFDALFGIWANFNVTTTFEPGSTYKSFTVAKALDAGAITQNQMFYCVGFKYVAGHRIRCWIYPRGHGQLNLSQALAVSCNVAHMDIAEALGRDAFWQYQRDFGFGQTTGIDLPGENTGLVFGVNELNASELATSSFGQRFTTTPIQNITAFSALVNGGNIVRPHVVSHVLNADGTTAFAESGGVQRRVISPAVSDWVRVAMADVVNASYGTGRLASIEGFTQGGKTATGEQGLQEDNPDFAWSISYIGYFPVQNPEFIVQVLLHEVQPAVYDAGFRSAVPMYREMMSEIIRIRSLSPCVIVAEPGTLHESEFVESFVGMNVQDAINRLNAIGRPHELSGSGSFVATHFPPAGVRSTGNTPIILHLADDGRAQLIPVPDVVGQPLYFARELLISSGFVPRNAFTELDGAGIVYAQTGAGLALPAGTDIVINIR